MKATHQMEQHQKGKCVLSSTEYVDYAKEILGKVYKEKNDLFQDSVISEYPTTTDFDIYHSQLTFFYNTKQLKSEDLKLQK